MKKQFEVGAVYEITHIDFDDNKRTFQAEYRGTAEDYGYHIFWEVGDSMGRDYYEGDIVRAKKIK